MTLDEYFGDQVLSRQLFDAIYNMVTEICPVELCVTKSQVAFVAKKTLARVWIPGKYLHGKVAPLVLTLVLHHRDPCRAGRKSSSLRREITPTTWSYFRSTTSMDRFEFGCRKPGQTRHDLVARRCVLYRCFIYGISMAGNKTDRGIIMMTNPTIDMMLNRKSIRKYTAEIPTDEVIQAVVCAEQQAPFAAQLCSLLLTRKKGVPFGAPLLFTICVDLHRMEPIMHKRGW